MTPVPGVAGSDEVLGWRLDLEQFSATWNSGEGAFLYGGRWNSAGVRAVYCSIDPSTAILEVAVHKGFRTLDTVPHILTALKIDNRSTIFIVDPGTVPNPNWLRPGIPSAGQQAFGDSLLKEHPFLLIPSAVSAHSWNLIFDPGKASGQCSLKLQERFALDPRLHPPAR